jgi:DNA polymerase-3 subunit alpha
MGDQFAHLHVHTEFSMLDGASRVDQVAAAAAGDGQPAVGITDHGNMYGVLPFYEACKKAGVKPIIGTEAYMAYDRRDERIAVRGKTDDSGGEGEGGKKAYYHLTLLAENNVGYKNLIQLSSRAYLEGYYRKPKVDWDLLSEHHQGVIATTGCLGGHVLQSLLADDFAGALAKAGRLQDIFGPDNLFIELQDHGIADQHRTNPQLVAIAKRLGAPLVATNDSHYTHASDAEAHDALLCVQTGAMISQSAAERFKFSGSGHYLKSAAEMRSLFTELPEACDNTLWIAERSDLELSFGKPTLPNFPLPAGFATADQYLQHLTFEGARQRWGTDLPDEAVQRIAYELKVIEDMGFSSYFLIVWDLIRHASEQRIRTGPGRGSAAGCAVAYCLRITDIDPLRYDLLFERFLNPSRVSMPDIDMDFDSRYRDEMIRYAAERYGRDHVAQIVTFSTIKARAAVRDAARVLGYPYSVGDRVAKAMPPVVMGRDTPLWAALADAPPDKYADGWRAAAELRNMAATDPEVERVVTVARGLEGLRRQDGIHAAAVVITKDPLTEYLPVQRKPEPGGNPEDAPVVTQYEMHGVEDLGLLKMDFLGLRNLDVLTDTVELIAKTRGVDLDIDHIPLDDPKTYELLRRGDTMGVFQLEGTAMRALIRSLEPTTFDDVAALVALYRPGPMAANMHNDYADRKNKRQEVTYLHPDAADVLGDTYGLMIYQEKLMRVAQTFAGYSLADADNLRRACGKKIREKMAIERQRFVAGCVATGYTKELGEQWFNIIEPFADYAFPKAHAYGYGYIAYQTAYLKAQYPVEYFAALLTSVRKNLDQVGVYLAECRAMGLTVTVPDVNASSAAFTPICAEDGTWSIAFGLSAIRNAGEALAEMIVAEREAGGKFADFYDFCERVPLAALNKRSVEALIKAGAFDSLGHPRAGLLYVFESIITRTTEARKRRDMGMLSLFELPGADDVETFDDRIAIPATEWNKKERLAAEKEMLGLYVSDHPLLGIEAALRRRTTAQLSELSGCAEGDMTTCAGVISGLNRKWTKKGDLMAVFTLEDLAASTEVMVFPRTMQEYGHLLNDDTVIVMKARVNRRDEQPKLVAMEISVFDVNPEGNEPLRLALPAHGLSERLIQSLKHTLTDHPGRSTVYLHFGQKVLRLPADFNVDIDSGVIGELRILLGESVLVSAPTPSAVPAR